MGDAAKTRARAWVDTLPARIVHVEDMQRLPGELIWVCDVDGYWGLQRVVLTDDEHSRCVWFDPPEIVLDKYRHCAWEPVRE
jgi:hypothetical protein